MEVALATAVIASGTVSVAQVTAARSIMKNGGPKDIVETSRTRVTRENRATMMTSAGTAVKGS